MTPADTDGLVSRLRDAVKLRQRDDDTQYASGFNNGLHAALTVIRPLVLDTIEAQAARIAELDAEAERAWDAYRIAFDQAMHNGQAAMDAKARIAELERALERCADIVERHNWRQSEKVDDVKLIARQALGPREYG